MYLCKLVTAPGIFTYLTLHNGERSFHSRVRFCWCETPWVGIPRVGVCVCLVVCVCIWLCVSVCLVVCEPVCLFLSVSVSLSMSLSLPVSLSECVSVCHCLCLCLCFCVSLCMCYKLYVHLENETSMAMHKLIMPQTSTQHIIT